MIVLGLSELDFLPTGADAAKLASDLASRCSKDFEPPVRPEIDVCRVDGALVVVADVPETDAAAKPCSVVADPKTRPPLAYIRSHDGNRRLTAYEHHALHAARGQPRDDLEPVDGTSTADLDPELVDALLRRLRSRSGTRQWPDDEAACLRLLGVLVEARHSTADGSATGAPPAEVVSLAGLLALGRYPQRYFPRLEIAFAAYPTTSGAPLADGTRLLDSQPIDGSIPAMLETAAEAIRRSTRRRAVVVGLWREDHWEFPLDAVREVVVNALMHRDYHSAAQGQPVMLTLYPDRLEIASPGGLYGAIDPDRLLTAPVTAARNSHLAKLLRDLPTTEGSRTVSENFGTGLLAVAESLRAAGLAPPEFEHSLTEFRVVFWNHTVLDDDATAWLSVLEANRHGRPSLSDRQRLALAHIRRHGSIDNRTHRALTGASAVEATNDLAALRDEELIERRGGRRWASWHLADGVPSGSPADDAGNGERATASVPSAAVAASTAIRRGGAAPMPSGQTRSYGDAEVAIPAGLPTERDQLMIDALSDGPRSTKELAEHFGVTPAAIRKRLRRLEDRNLVRPTEAGRRSRFQRWVSVGPASPPVA
ncbi:ATP-binding protein [Candidatus Poriferisodalis sp.]|uniref:ATP-binding protein n=1 Tax=Candidatus Poriferisodalis sp. TaxID=3101277 RepID=UPI003B014BDE